MKSLLTLLLCLYPLVSFTAYERLSLVARASYAAPYRLPTPSSLSNTNPVIDDNGTVIFKYLGVEPTASRSNYRLWMDSSEFKGEIATIADDLLMGDPVIGPNGEVAFAAYDWGYNDGLYRVRPGFASELWVAPSETPEAQQLNSLSFSKSSEIFWREFTKDQTRSLKYKNAAGEIKEILAEGDEILGGTIRLFLTPQKRGEFTALKVLLDTNNRSEPEEALLLLSEKSETIRLELPEVQKVSFHNNLALNSKGQIAVIASFERAGVAAKGLWFYHHETQKWSEIARVNQTEITELETFAPSLNERGQIVFRAKDHQGRRSIFSWSAEQGLQRQLGEGDLCPLENLGTGRILLSSWGPGLAGAPSLNNLGEVVFSAVIEEKNGGERLGSGIYRLRL